MPVALDAVVVRSLDPDPLKRYADGVAMAAALERLLVAPAPAARSERPTSSVGRPEALASSGAPTRGPASTSRPQAGVRARRRGPILAVLAVAGVMLGAVAVAVFPGIGNGAGAIAAASNDPEATETATPGPAPTPDPTVAPVVTATPTDPPSDPTPEPSRTAPPIVAALDLCEPLFGFPCGQDPGHYGPSRFIPATTFDLGDGWSTELHSTDRVILDRNEGRLTLLGDVTRVYPKGEEQASAGSLRKVIGRIASTAGTGASKVRNLTIDGRTGFSVDLTADGDQIVPILGVGEETVYLQPYATTRFVLLDAGDRTLALIIEPTGGASLRDILATADAVAASVDIR